MPAPAKWTMLFDRLAGLSLSVEDVRLTRRTRETSSGFERVTTTVHLDSGTTTGRGEDVTYEAGRHDEFLAAGPPSVEGSYSLAEFSALVGERDLFPTAPDREEFRHYRRWAFESAALDLALRQADTDLGSALDRTYDPVRFVVSTRLGDPPTADRIAAIRANYPEAEFKLDPTPEWGSELAAEVADRAPVRILDLKGQYSGTEVDVPADPDLYRLVLETFPEAVVEDPAMTDETTPLFEGDERRSRVSWDQPITGIESVEALPFEPSWLNVKPSRFGSVESLLDTVEYARRRDIRLYSGGQFELGVGRRHIQLLASLLYPDGPNDVAPGGYNDPDVPVGLPRSPLAPPADPVGFGGDRDAG